MCCDETHAGIDAAFDPVRCKCRAAVLRAYGELTRAGQPAKIALFAAKAVYRYHHPEDMPHVAGLTVERWVNAGQFH